MLLNLTTQKCGKCGQERPLPQLVDCEDDPNVKIAPPCEMCGAIECFIRTTDNPGEHAAIVNRLWEK
jgi:hypothetical protein